MLEIKNISKQFKKDEKLILKGVNLRIDDGEIVGLIGKNGAGKTTLMKMIAKTKKPTSGHIYLNQQDIFQHNNILSDVGIMIDTVYYDHLSAKRNLLYYLKVNHKVQYIKNVDHILELVGLLNTKDKKVKDFSFGMKQRLSLAMCLLTEPKLAIMDEPFVGLDPNDVKTLIDALKNWVENKNISLLISSHQLNELEEVCDRFVILKDGEVHPVELNAKNYLKIIFGQDIKQEDQKAYMDEFSIIDRIEGNVIYVEKGAENYNDLMQKIMTKYTLVSVENSENDLYQAYDYYENKEEK